MDDPLLPSNSKELTKHLFALRKARRNQHAVKRQSPIRRNSLKPKEREQVLKKTGGRCHICGGDLMDKWEADHVLPHGSGGAHAADNYLAAHSLCNNYRWSYTPEEFQWVLKIGVWARLQMEHDTVFGAELTRRFFDYEVKREKRRKAK